MVNPVLKRLRRASGPVEIAELARKHVGSGSSPYVCAQAFETIMASNINMSMKLAIAATKELTYSSDDSWGEVIDAVISLLLNGRMKD